MQFLCTREPAYAPPLRIISNFLALRRPSFDTPSFIFTVKPCLVTVTNSSSRSSSNLTGARLCKANQAVITSTCPSLFPPKLPPRIGATILTFEGDIWSIVDTTSPTLTGTRVALQTVKLPSGSGLTRTEWGSIGAFCTAAVRNLFSTIRSDSANPLSTSPLFNPQQPLILGRPTSGGHFPFHIPAVRCFSDT